LLYCEVDMNSTTKKYIEDIKKHIEISMCVDGDVQFLDFTETGKLIKTSDGELVDPHGIIFECNDSKRGRFFIAWYKEFED